MVTRYNTLCLGKLSFPEKYRAGKEGALILNDMVPEISFGPANRKHINLLRTISYKPLHYITYASAFSLVIMSIGIKLICSTVAVCTKF